MNSLYPPADQHPRLNRKRQGITLTEVLVTIGIMTTLMSLLLPAIQSARSAAARTKCQNNLRQIGTAMYSHLAAHDCFPSGGQSSIFMDLGYPVQRPREMNNGVPARKQHQSWGWAYQLLPYLDHENRWNNPSDSAVQGSRVELYLCPVRDQTTIMFGSDEVGLSPQSKPTASGRGPKEVRPVRRPSK